MAFTLVIDPRAIQDVQKAIDYYEEQQAGLGKRFETTLNKHLLILEKNPYFRIRYDQVRCIPMKKFPYMVHFTVDEKQAVVTIMAVFHTALDSDKWKEVKL
jgi:toxin ParE1/3/4